MYRYGHLVLDIHGGVSDVRDGGGATQPVTSQTMFVLMSSTKPLAAACLYLLKERGQLAWDDPVATYWPEFGQHGKATVTVRHVLTHRGGFPETPKDLPPHDWPDWSKVTSAMERAPAVYTPGETIAYHLVRKAMDEIVGPQNQAWESYKNPQRAHKTYVRLKAGAR